MIEIKIRNWLTPWLMECGGSMPHSQGLSNNPYPELNQPNSTYWIPISLRSILILSSHLCLCLPKGIFPVGLHVQILKAFLPSSILLFKGFHFFIGITTYLDMLICHHASMTPCYHALSYYHRRWDGRMTWRNKPGTYEPQKRGTGTIGRNILSVRAVI